MSVILNNQILYSCHLNNGNRWHDGVFAISVEDNILTVAFREPRADVSYKRVIPGVGARTTTTIQAVDIPFYVVLFKQNATELGLQQYAVDFSDGSDANPHTKESWSFDLSSFELGTKFKVMVVGILPAIENRDTDYIGYDSALDASEWKDNSKSIVYIVPDPTTAPFPLTEPVSDPSSGFSAIVVNGTVTSVLSEKEVCYALYVSRVENTVKEWFSYIVGEPLPVPVDYDGNVVFRTGCGTGKIYLAPLFEDGAKSVSLTIGLFGDTSREDPIVIEADDLDNGYYDFEVEEDGLYVLQIVVGTMTYIDYFFEYCGVERCYDSLINSIYCADNSCCTGCSDDVIRDREMKRNDLLMLSSFMNYIAWAVNYYRAGYTGFNIGDDRSVVMEKVGLYYSRVQSITERCGSCSESNIVDNECSQCG